MQRAMNPIPRRGLVPSLLATLILLGHPGARVIAQEAASQAPQAEAPAPTDTEQTPKLRKRLVDAASENEEWNPAYRADPAQEIEEMLAQADRAFSAGRVLEDTDGALDTYLRVLRRDPANAAARAGVDRAVGWAVQRGEAAIGAGRFDEGSRMSSAATRQRPNDPAVRALAAKIAAGRELSQLLATAQQLLEQGNLTAPEGNSAVDAYRAVLAKDSANATAQAGLERVQSSVIAQAIEAAQAGDFARADQQLDSAGKVIPGAQAVQDAGVRITELRSARAATLEPQIVEAIESSQFDAAEGLLKQLDGVSLQPRQVEDLRTRLFNAKTYASLKPGQRLTDPLASGGNGPEMVVIPLGSFTLGSPKTEKGRAANEGPQVQVKFARAFAMAATETTVAEFRRFVKAAGYSPTSLQTRKSTVYDESTGALGERSGVDWEDDHLGHKAGDNLPVIHVSWQDARAYAAWLSKATGKSYRLPSEAEFEYALRAGSNTPYPWGDGVPSKAIANVTGSRDRSESKRNWLNAFANYSDGFWGPAPVRGFEPNRFGLYDMVGNVSEWVEDCWHDTYQRAPTDGSAWVNDGCGTRMLRGSSWASAPEQVRSAFRLGASPGSVDARLGFRLVRDL